MIGKTDLSFILNCKQTSHTIDKYLTAYLLDCVN